MQILAWNPLVLAAIAAAGYPLALLLRRYGGVIVLALCATALALFLALPGGRLVLETADELPSKTDRVSCVVASIGNGAPFDKLAPARSAQCRFDGRGFPGSISRSEGEQLIQDSLH